MHLLRTCLHPFSVYWTVTKRNLSLRAASEMAGLRRLLEGMRQEMQGLEDELFALREERAVVEMERAAAADEADAAAAAMAAATRRQADLVAAVDEVRCPFGNAAVSGLLKFVWWNLCEIVGRVEMP
jgi:septal ring factor EnvC (AmiA/AmiB activator)